MGEGKGERPSPHLLFYDILHETVVRLTKKFCQVELAKSEKLESILPPLRRE